MKFPLARLLFSILLCSSLAAPSSANAQNVVLISLDDVGIDKVGSFGFPTPAPTPNIDALAQIGVTFRNAWAYPYCSPSRAATLTGLHAVNNGVGTNPLILIQAPSLSPRHSA